MFLEQKHGKTYSETNIWNKIFGKQIFEQQIFEQKQYLKTINER